MDLKHLLFGTPAAAAKLSPQAPDSTENWLSVVDIRNGVVVLKDGRYIKIVEILPVNFLLKSPTEQENIIFSYASYLKISPANLQVCVVTRPEDISGYAARMQEYRQNEEVPLCRELIDDNIREVEYLAANEALHKSIYLVFELEPNMRLRANTPEAIGDRLHEEEQTARRYLDSCGLEVLSPEFADNFQLNTLYEILNPRTSKSNPLPLTVFDAATNIAGVSPQEIEEGACRVLEEDEPGKDEGNKEKQEQGPGLGEPVLDDEIADTGIFPDSTAAESGPREGEVHAWNVGPIPKMPRRKREKASKRPKAKKEKRHKKNKQAKEEPSFLAETIQSGTVSVPDLLAPASIARGHADYIIVDGLYHSVLFIVGYGYETVVSSGWLAPLVEAGEGVNLSFHMRRQRKETVLPKISQTTMLNRSRMRDVGDTRQDFEELDSAISAGLYLKDEMNRNNEDFYYMSTLIDVSATTASELEARVGHVETLCASMSIVVKRCDYQHEQAYLSCLPLLSLDPAIERKAKRNILTTGIAAAFPFSSFSINDPGGIMIGINLHNYSLCMLDPFDRSKYEAPHISVLGMTGAGKTMFLQCLGLRFREQGKRVIIIIPRKGFEYRPACEAVGGKYIKLAPSSKDCINIMEIRRKTLNPDSTIRRLEERGDSLLADKITTLHVFFSLRKPDATEEQRNYLDEAIVRCYENFGITYDNASLLDEQGRRKNMPTLCDLYEVLNEREETRCYATVLLRVVKGSAKNLGGQTNVDTDAQYMVIDISDIGKDLIAEGMLIASEFGYDICKDNILQQKVMACDELWALIGANSTPLAAEYVLEMVKLLRAYSTCFINASQDLIDYFALNSGVYGRAILNASRIKVILPLEEEEARLVQKELNLSEAETMQIIRSHCGEGLLCARQNRISIAIRPTRKEYDLITTSRDDLLRQAQEAQEGVC